MQIVRFGFVGIFATCVHIFVAMMALQFTTPVLANLSGFFVAFLVSFLGHSIITFRERGHILKFAIVTCVGLGINNMAFILLITFDVASQLSLVLAAFPAPLVVYFMSKIWAFRS